ALFIVRSVLNLRKRVRSNLRRTFTRNGVSADVKQRKARHLRLDWRYTNRHLTTPSRQGRGTCRNHRPQCLQGGQESPGGSSPNPLRTSALQSSATSFASGRRTRRLVQRGLRSDSRTPRLSQKSTKHRQRTHHQERTQSNQSRAQSGHPWVKQKSHRDAS